MYMRTARLIGCVHGLKAEVRSRIWGSLRLVLVLVLFCWWARVAALVPVQGYLIQDGGPRGIGYGGGF